MNLRNITDFTEKEYKQQAQSKNFSSIANIFGFKPTANKVLFTTLSTTNFNTWSKVDFVSNFTASNTEYLGGADNIDKVTVGLARDFDCSNNMPLFETDGDFGARLDKTASASRYIRVRKSSILDNLFDKVDFNILPRYRLEGKLIENQFLTFNLPMLLINGSEGMGSGHAQLILPRNPNEVMEYLKYRLKSTAKTPKQFISTPFYKGFNGNITQGIDYNKWLIKGTIKRISKFKLEITELPVVESYKSYIKKLDTMVDKGIIRDYEDLCDTKTDKFKFIISCDKTFTDNTDDFILEKLKLIEKPSENYTIMDENNEIHVHKNVHDIMEHYIEQRLYYMYKRKEYLIEANTQELKELASKYLFIKAVTEETLIINKRLKNDIIKDMEQIIGVIKVNDSFDYLLNMSIMSLTKERMEKIFNDITLKKEELDKIKNTTIQNMWLNDLKKINL